MELFAHQKRALKKVLDNDGIGAIYHYMGLGKTRTTIEIFKELKKVDKDLKLLVFCPIGLIESAWADDTKKFSCLSFQNLRKKHTSTADINAVNYESLNSTKLLQGLVTMVKSGKWAVALDESSKIKNNTAQTTKIMLKMKQFFRHRMIMSGTPAPNIEWEYWPQMTFLQDSIFHHNFYIFKGSYFHLERGNQRMLIQQGQVLNKVSAREMFSKGWKYGITQENREKIFKRMEKWCDFCNDIDMLQLPEVTVINHKVQLVDEQKRTYEELRDDLITEIMGQNIVVSVALAKIMKLREITSGFVMNAAGQRIVFDKNPKLEELMNILENIGDKQVIIWCNFVHEIETIQAAIGAKARSVYGGSKEFDDEVNLRNFKEGRLQILIANPSSVGYGFTFINCHYHVFFSVDNSWEKYDQARQRTQRFGQKNGTVYINLLAENTIDEKIMNNLNRKGQASELVFDFLGHDRISLSQEA